MRINMFALIAAAVTVLALFLPWLSFDNMLMGGLIFIYSHSFSPFQVASGYLAVNGSTNSVIGNYGTGVWQPKPYFYSSDWYTWQAPQLFMFSVTLLYLFAIGLMAQASFADGSWSKVGKKGSIIASNLLFISIFLYALSVCWLLFAKILPRPLALTPSDQSWASPPSNSVFYLDLGFWGSILGAMLAFASWLHPKFINVDTKIKPGLDHALKWWLPVAEWEKSAVIATASFLAVFIFAIFYLPLI